MLLDDFLARKFNARWFADDSPREARRRLHYAISTEETVLLDDEEETLVSWIGAKISLIEA